MALIKSAQASRVVRNAVVLNLADVQRDAAQMLDRARQEADAMLAAARTKARALIDAADARGYQDGQDRGAAAGMEQGRGEGRDQALAQLAPRLEELIMAWTGALGAWARDRDAMLTAAREDVLAFAAAMSRRVVHRLAALDRTIVRDQLAEALALLSRPTAAVVTINPLDRDAAQSLIPALLEQFRNCTHVQLAVDEGIDPGGCLIATAGGCIDATLPTQIDRIIDVLLPDPGQRLDARIAGKDGVDGAPPRSAAPSAAVGPAQLKSDECAAGEPPAEASPDSGSAEA